jgi:hypothetical protein
LHANRIMLFIIASLTILVLITSGITTIPLSIGLLAVTAVLFEKSWVFFLAFGLGLFLDLNMIRPLGYASLVLAIFILLIRLYERKFETQTAIFVIVSSFLGSLIYLVIFDSQQFFLQSLFSSLFAILMFKLLWLKLGPRSETT